MTASVSSSQYFMNCCFKKRFQGFEFLFIILSFAFKF